MVQTDEPDEVDETVVVNKIKSKKQVDQPKKINKIVEDKTEKIETTTDVTVEDYTTISTESSETVSGRLSENYEQTTTDELFIINREEGRVTSYFSFYFLIIIKNSVPFLLMNDLINDQI